MPVFKTATNDVQAAVALILSAAAAHLDTVDCHTANGVVIALGAILSDEEVDAAELLARVIADRDSPAGIGTPHRHEYRRDVADWWCWDCDTVTDHCLAVVCPCPIHVLPDEDAFYCGVCRTYHARGLDCERESALPAVTKSTVRQHLSEANHAWPEGDRPTHGFTGLTPTDCLRAHDSLHRRGSDHTHAAERAGV